MTREVLKVFCRRNDRVGTVTADADGYTLNYVSEVSHHGAVFGSPATLPLTADETTALNGYCKRCKAPVMLSAPKLRKQAIDGVREVHVPFATDVDKQWVDAGRDAIYPPDVEWLRHDPRDSES
jgi:hypothetical protein